MNEGIGKIYGDFLNDSITISNIYVYNKNNEIGIKYARTDGTINDEIGCILAPGKISRAPMGSKDDLNKQIKEATKHANKEDYVNILASAITNFTLKDYK